MQPFTGLKLYFVFLSSSILMTKGPIYACLKSFPSILHFPVVLKLSTDLSEKIGLSLNPITELKMCPAFHRKIYTKNEETAFFENNF